MSQFITITTTSDDRDGLKEIAHRLIEERLAACCQLIGPHTSIYRWQDQVETATEWMCLIKTKTDLYEAVEARIRALHTYEIPEIIATPIEKGHEGYLQWIDESVSDE